MNRRRAGILAGLVLALIVVNVGIAGRERLLREGETVLLALAPVDPRSLMQGDYMALDFALADEVRTFDGRTYDDGYFILRRDAAQRARFVRLQSSPQPRDPDQLALRYRVRAGHVRIVSNAWFFSEGQAARYEAARFGELRVGADGEALLVAMRDEQLQPL